ncbi:hypothetical protein MJH12_07515 [bacterium]|nr:hypothetical protein [bacterium]
MARSFGICVGNEQGSCLGNDPATCGITRLAVGTSLAATADVDQGRTSFSRYPIEFTHNGASASFTVRPLTTGQDVGLSVTEQVCD